MSTVGTTGSSRRTSRRTWVRWLPRVGLSGLVLLFLATRVDLQGALEAVRQADVEPVVLALAAYLAYRLLFAYQMSFGLAPLGMHLPVSYLVRVTLIAGFYSIVLPGGLLAGGAASWYKLSRSSGKTVEAAALVVFFRLLNTAVLLAMGLAALALDSQVPSAQARGVGFSLLCGVVILLGLVLSVRAAGAVGRASRRVGDLGWVPNRLRLLLHEALTAASCIQSMRSRVVAQIVGLSVLLNALSVLVWLLLARAVGIGLSAYTIGWISSFLIIAQLVPVTVAGLGVREASLLVLLGQYGVPQAQALAFSLLVLSTMIIEATAGGVLESHELLTGAAGRRAAVTKGRAHDGEVLT